MKGYFIVLMVLLSACAAKKQAAEFEAQPFWMKQKPIIPGYYVGIGSAKKLELPQSILPMHEKMPLPTFQEKFLHKLASLQFIIQSKINMVTLNRMISGLKRQ